MWASIPALLMCGAGADRTWEPSHNLAMPVPPASAPPVFTSFQPHQPLLYTDFAPKAAYYLSALPATWACQFLPIWVYPSPPRGGLPWAPSPHKSSANLSQHCTSTTSVPRQRVVMYCIWACTGSMPFSSAPPQANPGQGPHLCSPPNHNRAWKLGGFQWV